MAVSLNTGALVLYHGKFAAVTAINKEKIEIRVEGGASKSVRPKDVEFLHRGPVSSLPPIFSYFNSFQVVPFPTQTWKYSGLKVLS